MTLPALITPDLWLRQLFSAQAARDGGVVRRSVRDVERILGRAAFERALRRRGYRAVENKVHVNDLHATLLHQFGIDHARFSTKFQGLDYKLTGVEPAHVVKDLIA